ncbi:MAG TPA: CIA30 family protein [Gammaproteobacteria bacterium]|nr:CIA30 family protein [Gammaproteobacteria bacterium]
MTRALVSALGGLLAGVVMLGVNAAETEKTDNTMLIDDFSRADGNSALGTRWESFTDRVMGGVSDMQVEYRESDGQRVLHMAGQVRLENRGGFIQVRLPVDPAGGSIDASAWDGISIRVRGRPGAYYLHLRTRQNWMPWQYFRAPMEVGRDWQEQRIAFDEFAGVSTRRKLDLDALKSIAVVAYGEAFEADIEIARIGFYARHGEPLADR